MSNILCVVLCYGSIASVLLWGEGGGHYCYLFVMLHQLIWAKYCAVLDIFISITLGKPSIKLPLVFLLVYCNEQT